VEQRAVRRLDDRGIERRPLRRLELWRHERLVAALDRDHRLIDGRLHVRDVLEAFDLEHARRSNHRILGDFLPLLSCVPRRQRERVLCSGTGEREHRKHANCERTCDKPLSRRRRTSL
jgi:hypothetical protein